MRRLLRGLSVDPPLQAAARAQQAEAIARSKSTGSAFSQISPRALIQRIHARGENARHDSETLLSELTALFSVLKFLVKDHNFERFLRNYNPKSNAAIVYAHGEAQLFLSSLESLDTQYQDGRAVKAKNEPGKGVVGKALKALKKIEDFQPADGTPTAVVINGKNTTGTPTDTQPQEAKKKKVEIDQEEAKDELGDATAAADDDAAGTSNGSGNSTPVGSQIEMQVFKPAIASLKSSRNAYPVYDFPQDNGLVKPATVELECKRFAKQLAHLNENDARHRVRGVHDEEDEEAKLFPINTPLSLAVRSKYSDMVKFLYYTSRGELDDCPLGDELIETLKQMHNVIVRLRLVEACVASRLVRGFSNKADNVLALLMYQGADADDIEEYDSMMPSVSEEQRSGSKPSAPHMLLSSESTMYKNDFNSGLSKAKTTGVLYRRPVVGCCVGLVLLLLIASSFLVTWFVWRISMKQLLREQIGDLSRETQVGFIESFTAQMQSGYAAVSLGAVAFEHGVIPPLQGLGYMNHFAFDTWLLSELRILPADRRPQGIYFATDVVPGDWEYVGVFELDGGAPGEYAIRARVSPSNPLSATYVRPGCAVGAVCQYIVRVDEIQRNFTRPPTPITGMPSPFNPQSVNWLAEGWSEEHLYQDGTSTETHLQLAYQRIIASTPATVHCGTVIKLPKLTSRISAEAPVPDGGIAYVINPAAEVPVLIYHTLLQWDVADETSGQYPFFANASSIDLIAKSWKLLADASDRTAQTLPQGSQPPWAATNYDASIVDVDGEVVVSAEAFRVRDLNSTGGWRSLDLIAVTAFQSDRFITEFEESELVSMSMLGASVLLALIMSCVTYRALPRKNSITATSEVEKIEVLAASATGLLPSVGGSDTDLSQPSGAAALTSDPSVHALLRTASALTPHRLSVFVDNAERRVSLMPTKTLRRMRSKAAGRESMADALLDGSSSLHHIKSSHLQALSSEGKISKADAALLDAASSGPDETLSTLFERLHFLLEQSYAEVRRGKRRSMIVHVLGILLAISFLLVWGVWTLNSRLVIDNITSSTVDQTLNNIEQNVERYLEAGISTMDHVFVDPSFEQDAPELLSANSTSRNDSAISALIERAIQLALPDLDDSGFHPATFVYVVANDTEGQVSMSGGGWHNSLGNNPVRFVSEYNPDNGCLFRYRVAGLGTSTLLRGAQLGGVCDYTPLANRRNLNRVMFGSAPYWSRVYSLTDELLGITYARPFIGKTGLRAVIAVDLSLAPLSEFLRSIQVGESNKTQSLILEPRAPSVVGDAEGLRTSEVVVGNSEYNADGRPDIISATECGLSRLLAKDIFNDALRSIVNFLQDPLDDKSLKEQGITVIGGDGNVTESILTTVTTSRLTFRRTLDAPVTFVKAIELPDGLTWNLVLSSDQDDFFGKLEDTRTLTLLVTVGSLFIVVVILTVAFKSLKKHVLHNQLHDIAMKELGKVNASRHHLVKHMNRIKPAIIIAMRKSYAALYGDKGAGEQLPQDFHLMNMHATDRALAHIKDSQKNKNILTMCQLEHYDSRWPSSLYSWLVNPRLQFVVQLVTVLHICLQFAKPARVQYMQEEGVQRNVVVVELGCLIVEVSYISFSLLLELKWKTSNFISGSHYLVRSMLLAVAVSACIFDFLVMIFFDYSIEYIVPVRIAIFALMNNKIHRAAIVFVRTAISAIDVLILFFSVVVVSACFGLVLFRNEFNVGRLDDTFANFIRSSITSFVYISTGENYTTTVYPAFAKNEIYVIFFLLLTIVGMFFIITLVIAAFQEAFERFQKESIRKEMLVDRTGAVAAFVLLDLDQSGKLSCNEFTSFMRRIRPTITDIEIDSIFKRVDKNFDGEINVPEFVEGVDEVLHSIRYDKKKAKLSGWREWLHNGILSKKYFRRMMLLLVLVMGIAVSLYGLVDPKSEKNLDTFLFAILGLFMIETLTRVSLYGFTVYWNYALYDRGAYVQEFANRFDLAVLCAAGALYGLAAAGTALSEDQINIRRFMLTLPLLRAFTVIQRNRHLFYTLTKVLPVFASLFSLLIIIMYVFAMYGMLLFADKYQRLKYSQTRTPDGDFNSLGNSFLVLFQLLVGEGWHEHMYASITVTSWNASYYYVTYIIVVSLLFTNLFIGVILSAFKVGYRMQNSTTWEIKKRLLEGDEEDEVVRRLRADLAKSEKELRHLRRVYHVKPGRSTSVSTSRSQVLHSRVSGQRSKPGTLIRE